MFRVLCQVTCSFYTEFLEILFMVSEADLRLFDLLSYSFKSFSLIKDLNDALIAESSRGKIGPASQFYFAWRDRRIDGKQEMPLNPGLIWMMTSAVIVASRERWLEYLPDIPLSNSEPEWGLTNAHLDYPTNPDPSIKRVVQKIRNSISHADFDFVEGGEGTSWFVYLSESHFVFRDMITEHFEIKLSVIALSQLNKKIYETIYGILSKHETSKGS